MNSTESTGEEKINYLLSGVRTAKGKYAFILMRWRITISLQNLRELKIDQLRSN